MHKHFFSQKKKDWSNKNLINERNGVSFTPRKLSDFLLFYKKA